MRTLIVTARITYDDDLMHGTCWESHAWFFNTVLTAPLIVHSNEIGDEIGTMVIEEITDDVEE